MTNLANLVTARWRWTQQTAPDSEGLRMTIASKLIVPEASGNPP